ncbi:hypothetical protein LUZ60_000477 [Juncus effusus]|nr:hypothetical protein LUZ60_000477 [Juncus effusus]
MGMLWLLSLCFATFSLLALSQNNTEGYISIDCGYSGEDYSDNDTNLVYTSDSQFVQSGVATNIPAANIPKSNWKPFLTVRSFPNGDRNCYTIKKLVDGRKYLVRAMFLYGNYDGQNKAQANSPISFDLYLDTQLCITVNISDPSQIVFQDILTVARSTYISVCLRNKNQGDPFISMLELRPLDDSSYPTLNKDVSLMNSVRANMGEETQVIRYPNDTFDRIWLPWTNNTPAIISISTNQLVNNTVDDKYKAPSAVLQNAITIPEGSDEAMIFNWAVTISDNWHVIMYFAEFNRSVERSFDVYLNERKYTAEPIKPQYLYGSSDPYVVPSINLSTCQFKLEATKDSNAQPILNGIEIYIVLNLTNENQPTNNEDFYAIMGIKEKYNVTKNWMGDPCVPKDYAWNGLNCSYDYESTSVSSPRIIALNLSASGLTNEIDEFFEKLNSLQTLDLSNNNLTGQIPGFLGSLSSLQFLNLAGNQLSGPVPQSLLARSQDGSLKLSVDGLPETCTDDSRCKNKNKLKLPIIIGIAVPIVLLLLLAPIAWMKKRSGSHRRNSEKQSRESNSNHLVDSKGNPVQIDSQNFTYKDLEEVTKNFEQEIGKGGFGAVYLGVLFNGTQVAVKVLNSSSHQGAKEFLAEVQHLSRVHHKNLVSLVGYCNDGVHLALVYEYMSGGSLHASIRGNTRKRVLSWEERLRILLDASQGISYLHCECNPSIVHRDVKTDNILLNQMLEAKIADFGLCKAFQNDRTHISTAVAGTPGYLDPEYHSSFQLNEKSDVYSFGVVLLEVLTAQPPIIEALDEWIHITAWVRQKLTKGNMDDVADAELLGWYDVNSAWKIMDLAMKCCARTSAERPIMPDVVSELKESLELVLDLKKTRSISSLRTSSSRTTAFEVAKSDDDSLFVGPSIR